MKKILSVLLCFGLIFGFSGCKENNTDKNSSQETQTTETKKNKDYITLLYSAADSFNPYETKTDVNRQLCMLLYEPLVKLDNEFNPVYSIAQSVSIEGKVCTVKLKDTLFSDGSKLSSEDVIYSYNKAKTSATEYAAKLYEVVSVSSVGADTVIFNLNTYDRYFANVLDFPILKQGSDNLTDSDSVKLPPVGSGRYKVSEDRLSLVKNDYFPENGSITKIRLINTPDLESVSHYIEIGAADMYYSNISDGNILRMSGEKIDINLNNLVYIGVNHNIGELGLRELRQAISAGIDREKICKEIFYNNAIAANGFFNPVWQETKSVQNIQTTANSQITVENLKEIGYNNLDKEGFYRKSDGALRFTLLVNKENRIRAAAALAIANQLKTVGIKITVIEESYDNYLARLQSGDFQLYLAEVNITDNMDIRPVVTEGGSSAYGVKETVTEQIEGTEQPPVQNTSAKAVIEKFYTGETSVTDIAMVLQTDMPVIPVCYRTGILFCNDSIENVNNSSKSDIYFSIKSYKFKVN